MDNKEKNLYAFPVVFTDKAKNITFVDKGMTLRDYFAAKAMQGLLSNGQSGKYAQNRAFKIADAMLEEREKND